MKKIIYTVLSLSILSGLGYWFVDSASKKINVVSFDLEPSVQNEGDEGFSIPVVVNVKNDNNISFIVKNVSVMILDGTTLLARTTEPQNIRINSNSTTKFSHRMTIKSLKKITDIVMNPGNNLLTIVVDFTLFLFDFQTTLTKTI